MAREGPAVAQASDHHLVRYEAAVELELCGAGGAHAHLEFFAGHGKAWRARLDEEARPAFITLVARTVVECSENGHVSGDVAATDEHLPTVQLPTVRHPLGDDSGLLVQRPMSILGIGARCRFGDGKREHLRVTSHRGPECRHDDASDEAEVPGQQHGTDPEAVGREQQHEPAVDPCQFLGLDGLLERERMGELPDR